MKYHEEIEKLTNNRGLKKSIVIKNSLRVQGSVQVLLIWNGDL